jgi:release factor glutamine methyltransferase
MLSDLKREIRARLLALKIELSEATAEAEQIIASVTGLSRSEQVLRQEPIVLRWREDAFLILEKRKERVPLQYILGRAYFMGLEFMVAPGVFIPRPDTETLVEVALQIIPPHQRTRVIDIGTGSGILSVLIAKHRPSAKIVAVDVSSQAVDMARENAKRHAVLDQISFVHADWRTYLPEALDVIVSNPPYIPASEKESLPAEVIEYEPHVALFGEGKDGLGHYRQLAKVVPSCFAQPWGVGKASSGQLGWIVCEFGDGQAEDVLRAFTAEGFSEAKITNDISGKPRVISAAWTKG